METSLEALRQHLAKESENGSPTAILFAQVALFVNLLFLHKTTFISKHDPKGVVSVLSYQIVALLLPCSKHLSQRKFLPRSYGGFKVNFTMNCAFLLLAIPVENFFEKTKGSLGFVLSAAVLVIVLRVIIKPRNDFGVLGFLLGAAMSIACSVYKVGYKTWLVLVICLGLLGFRFLVVQNWFQVEDGDENQESLLPIVTRASSRTQEIVKRISKSAIIIEAIVVPGFCLCWDLYLIITNCPPHSDDDDLISCISYSVKKSVPSVVVLGLCFTLAIALRLYTSLPVANKKVRKTLEEMPDERIEVRISDDESREENIEQEVNDNQEIIMNESRPHPPMGLTTNTLRQRHKKPSKVTASFERILGNADLDKQLMIPFHFMDNLPAVEKGGSVYLNALDTSSGEQWDFEYCNPMDIFPKPVLQGCWRDYHRKKGLKSGDQIMFDCLDNEDGLPLYRIRAQGIAPRLNTLLPVKKKVRETSEEMSDKRIEVRISNDEFKEENIEQEVNDKRKKIEEKGDEQEIITNKSRPHPVGRLTADTLRQRRNKQGVFEEVEEEKTFQNLKHKETIATNNNRSRQSLEELGYDSVPLHLEMLIIRDIGLREIERDRKHREDSKATAIANKEKVEEEMLYETSDDESWEEIAMNESWPTSEYTPRQRHKKQSVGVSKAEGIRRQRILRKTQFDKEYMTTGRSKSIRRKYREAEHEPLTIF